MQYCNWAFKKKLLPFYPRLKRFFIWKSNGKSLSNCNSNCRGQPSGWIGWSLPSCTICTYRDPKLRQLDKKRSSPIIILLYSVWYCCRSQVPHIKNSIFWPWWWYCIHLLSNLNSRYESYNEQNINHRHRMYWFILLILEAPLILSEFSKTYFLQARPSGNAISA